MEVQVGTLKEPADLGVLTGWRQETEAHIRTPKETDQLRGTHRLETADRGTSQETNQPRGTHQLEIADRGTSQDTKTNKPTKGHSPTGDGRQLIAGLRTGRNKLKLNVELSFARKKKRAKSCDVLLLPFHAKPKSTDPSSVHLPDILSRS
jgi:hypothetical protein